MTDAHTMSNMQIKEAGPAAPILAWLAGEPSADPVTDLPELSAMLDALLSASLTAVQLRRGLELFAMRFYDVREMLVPRLIERALPLPADLFNAASELECSVLMLAKGYIRVMSNPDSGVLTQSRRPEVLATQALDLLADALWLAGLKGGAPRGGVWTEAHRIFHLANAKVGTTTLPAELPHGPVQAAYKRLLSLAAAQPEVGRISEFFARLMKLGSAST